MVGRRGLRDTCKGVGSTDDKPASRTRTLAEDEAAVGARWERSTGSTIGRYIVEDRLGAGAMGVVYKARDPKLGRDVAIKMSHASQGSSPRGAERFAREARAMAALHHPHVVQVYDYGVRDGDGFLVMELLEATTLTAWLETNPSEEARMRALRQAGEGLAAAHDAGLVHRDFKPGNVLITREGVAKVTDFGLARAYGDDESSSGPSPVFASERSGSGGSNTVTAHGVVIGTPAYMSPEQHRARPLTPQSDQYSFCLTAYEVLAGSRLFEAPTLARLEMLKDDGPALDAFRGLPLAVSRALRRGLQPRARDRFRDVRALLDAMQRRPLRVWGAICAGLVLPVALLALPPGNRGEVACGDDASALWNDEHRDAVRAVFVRSSSPGAAEAGTRVLEMLDDEAADWASAKREACGLTASERDIAEACLARRRLDFEQTRDRIAVRNAVSVDSAVATVSRLSDVDECLQPMSARLEAARMDPRTRAYLDEVDRRRAGAREAFRLGDRMAAVGELDAALMAARQIEPPALRAGPLSEVGNMLDTAGEGERGSEVLREAYDHAASADDDRAAASAAIRLIWVEGVTLGHIDEGRRWAREAETRMERFTARPDMAAAKFTNLAAIAQREGDLDQSLALMLRANAVGDADSGEVSTAKRRIVLLMAQARRQHNIGTLHYYLGDYDEALPAFQASVAASRAARGVGHPDSVDALEGVARSAEALGDLDLARVSAKSMIRIIEEHRGPAHPSVATAKRALASVEYAVGDLEEVGRLFASIVELLDAQEDRDYEMEAAAARVELCTVLRELGRVEEAGERAQEAYAIYERETDPRFAGHRAGALRELALVHSELGKHDEAVDYMRRASVAAADSNFERLNLVVFAIARLYVLNGAGRHDEAVEAGEQGLEFAREVPDAVDTMLLELRFAEALMQRGDDGDYARAQALLDSVQTKARRVGAEMILSKDLPDTQAELDAIVGPQ